MKKLSKELLQEKFIDFILSNNNKPDSVYLFMKELGNKEEQFYDFFGNLKALEQSIIKSLFFSTLETLNKNKDYQSFSKKDKLLSFYYTLFENLKLNRSYFVFLVNQAKNKKDRLDVLKGMKSDFTDYIKALGIDPIKIKNGNLSKFQSLGINNTAWLQLNLIFNYWLKDSSPSFEKTDLFIEKSINAGFDVIENLPLNSLIDFGKFIMKDAFAKA